MQKYKEINGNDYVKNSRTTINETMQSIQSMNSGTAFPTNNLFEGMKCYRTDLKKTYTLTDVENNTWVEDAHATLSDEATHAASATKLQTARSLNLGGAVTADAATFDGTANATINVKTLDATKLKGTASVSTTGNAATATKVVATAAAGASANIAEATMASSDYARIRVSGNDNAGELALETADDGSEPIVARQYTGIYTTPVRTAKILDESGNTSFPGTVVAPKFTGTLNGNAATATKLQTPRTLSLTGKAAGSATFDGSANAAINVTSVNADTASKLSTARKINITGNATGAATFDGSGDANINVSVSQAAHADKATNAGSANKLFYSEHGGNSIQNGANDFSPTVGGDSANMNITSWYGVSFTNGCNSGVIPQGKTAVGIDVRNSVVRAKTFEGALNGNAATATKLATARAISLTGNASGSAAFDGSGDISISTTVNESKHAANADTAANANKLASESGSNYLFINTEEDSWSVIGPNPGDWLKSIRTDVSAPPYSIGNYSTAIAFGGRDTKGIITHAYNSPDVKFAGGAGSTASWKFTIHGGSNNEFYDLNNFPTKTGGGASGTWGINISGNAKTATTANTATNATHASSADSATNADKVDGIHATSLFYNKGNWDANNWATIGTYQVNNNPPVSGAYGWGQVISSSTTDGRFQLYASHQNSNGRLRYRTGWDNDKSQPWNTILDSENYNLFAPTKTGGGASGTWGINISGNAASATNADKLDGYHASDIISKIQDITPKTAAAAGQFRELVVNDSHQVKLPDGGTWAYFVYTYNSWSGDDSNGEHRTRTGAGIAAGGTVLHTDGSITSNTINAFHLSGTTGADGADGNNIIVGGFCWRIA